MLSRRPARQRNGGHHDAAPRCKAQASGSKVPSSPPLPVETRGRNADLPALVAEILSRQAQELGVDCSGLAPAAMAVLRRHRFPGNVRELENVLRTALVACEGARIDASHLPIQQSASKSAFTLPQGGIDLDALERDIIKQAMQRAQGNRTRAATLLGLTRDQVRYRLSKIAESAEE
ncbi:MAG: hypothetical protein EOO73_11520 [Myxococcales bacterium]|nr:MAG: hypothetical protein EOO73_11520 [Myxococcales bacterium]